MTVQDARFLMTTVNRDGELEAEPVTVYEHKGQGHLVMDDGTEMVFSEHDTAEIAKVFAQRTERLRGAA